MRNIGNKIANFLFSFYYDNIDYFKYHSTNNIYCELYDKLHKVSLFFDSREVGIDRELLEFKEIIIKYKDNVFEFEKTINSIDEMIDDILTYRLESITIKNN